MRLATARMATGLPLAFSNTGRICRANWSLLTVVADISVIVHLVNSRRDPERSSQKSRARFRTRFRTVRLYLRTGIQSYGSNLRDGQMPGEHNFEHLRHRCAVI